MNRSNRGFTLIELLIATTLGVLVIFGALRVLNNLYASQQTARKVSELLNATEPIFNQLTQDIHWSYRYTFDPNAQVLTLNHNLNGQEEISTYRVHNQVLYRNNDPLFSDNLKLTDLTVNNRAPAGELPLLEVSLGLEHTSLRGSQASLTTKTTVSMRQTEEMEP